MARERKFKNHLNATAIEDNRRDFNLIDSWLRLFSILSFTISFYRSLDIIFVYVRRYGVRGTAAATACHVIHHWLTRVNRRDSRKRQWRRWRRRENDNVWQWHSRDDDDDEMARVIKCFCEAIISQKFHCLSHSLCVFGKPQSFGRHGRTVVTAVVENAANVEEGKWFRMENCTFKMIRFHIAHIMYHVFLVLCAYAIIIFLCFCLIAGGKPSTLHHTLSLFLLPSRCTTTIIH